jgi:hypothetical protein
MDYEPLSPDRESYTPPPREVNHNHVNHVDRELKEAVVVVPKRKDKRTRDHGDYTSSKKAKLDKEKSDKRKFASRS